MKKMQFALLWKVLMCVGLCIALPAVSNAEGNGKKVWDLSDDGINYLMAGDVAESIGLKERFSGTKRFGVKNWTKPEQVFSWPVRTSHAGDFDLSILVKLPKGTRLNISSKQETVEKVVAYGGWHRLNSSLRLGRGDEYIRIALDEPVERGELFSVEVITAKHLPVHKQRLAELKRQRGDVSWFQNAGFGLMFQWGHWGYPKEGDRKRPWQRVYREFDIEAFADKMERFDPGYVIWSITWRGSRFPAPLQSVEEIMNSKDFTLEYDFLGKLADALYERDIPLFLYYHPGHEEPEFWEEVWHGQDQRQHYQDCNVAIWTEIGNRLGKKLAGWFIDGGIVQHYPADFHRYKQALLAGNPKRLTTFNPWKYPKTSPFDDMSFGESVSGNVRNGVFIDGPNAGLLAHTMRIMDGPGWGIHKPNTDINEPRGDARYWQKRVDRAKANKHPISFCILMYEDGTLGQETKSILKQLKR